MIDGYAHLGMPRFWQVSDYLPVMEKLGITRALVCPFDSCPDLAECHLAISRHPDRFRAFGLALGRDRAEIEAGMRAQFDAGFDGFRFSVAILAAAPWLLDLCAAEDAVPMVVGGGGLADAAPLLLRFLEASPRGVVVAPHCAGPTDPALLRTPGPVADLFRHPRFTVVVSRQGLFEPTLISRWVEALVEVVGWSRLMWGSEAPIPYWRDEVLGSTPEWILRFEPSAEEREAFYSGNGERLVFARARRPVRPLALAFDPWDFEVKLPAPMFPYGLPADTRLPGRVVSLWLRQGGEAKEPLSSFVSRLLEDGLKAQRPAA